MKQIKAIGFDLFNTLITMDPQALDEAMGRLLTSLEGSDLSLEHEAFKQAYWESTLRFLKEARQNGRETHNRFWISEALETLGYKLPPDDPRITSAVDDYFSAFLQYCRLIPGTIEMLESIKGRCRLGLLSNFTHAPAAIEIIKEMSLRPFFDVVLVSGELGYRKPHPLVFTRLIDQLGVEKNQILFVGDDPEPDITGAQEAGLHPVWMTYVRDHDISFVPGYFSQYDKEPDSDVLRISTWNDLLALLDQD